MSGLSQVIGITVRVLLLSWSLQDLSQSFILAEQKKGQGGLLRVDAEGALFGDGLAVTGGLEWLSNGVQLFPSQRWRLDDCLVGVGLASQPTILGLDSAKLLVARVVHCPSARALRLVETHLIKVLVELSPSIHRLSTAHKRFFLGVFEIQHPRHVSRALFVVRRSFLELLQDTCWNVLQEQVSILFEQCLSRLSFGLLFLNVEQRWWCVILAVFVPSYHENGQPQERESKWDEHELKQLDWHKEMLEGLHESDTSRQ